MSQRLSKKIFEHGLGLCRRSFGYNQFHFNQYLRSSPVFQLKNKSEFKRFQHYYSTNSNHQENSNNESQTSQKKMSFKDLMKKYGWAAFIMYNIVTIIDTSIIFVSLYFAGADQVKYIENKVKEWSSYLSFSKPKDEPITEVVVADNQESEKPSLFSTFLVAYSIHQLLEPIRLPLVIFLTPSFALKLHRLNILKMKNI